MRSMKVSIILTTDRPATDRRPTTDDRPLISKISNGHISATGRPIHSMFGSRVGFSGTADLMALFLTTTCTASLLAFGDHIISHHCCCVRHWS